VGAWLPSTDEKAAGLAAQSEPEKLLAAKANEQRHGSEEESEKGV
jgi:hypothetical protein